MPAGWYFKQVVKEGTYSCFITREKIDGSKGRFFTGLTVFVIKDIPKIKKMSPSQYAQKYIEQVEKSGKKMLKKWSTVMGPFKGYGCLYSDGVNTVHNLLIANDKTGTVYIVLFESPEKEWKNAWKIGEPILKKLLIDDEI